MKKVFIIHGFEGKPNGGWRPWLMAELEKQHIYACALPMPSPEKPKCAEWIAEISRVVGNGSRDDIYLVGHSLGVPVILRFLEQTKSKNIRGAVLVSGPREEIEIAWLKHFFAPDFNFAAIKSNCSRFTVIHGDNDRVVPLRHAEKLAHDLDSQLIVIENGGHLNGGAGWLKLPQCLDALTDMIKN